MQNKGIWRYLLLFLLFVAFPNSLFAIGENYDETGFRSNKTYIEYSPQEYIDPFSGNLILSHTDIFLPGNGGLDLKIQRTYNSKLFLNPDTGEISRIRKGAMGIGWTFHSGRIVEEPDSVNGPQLYLEMPDGSIHNLYSNNHPNINSHIASDYITEDLWIINYDAANDLYTMTLTDGTVYIFGQRVADLITIYHYVTSIKDKNGNEIKIAYYDCCNTVNNDPDTGIIGMCPGINPITKTPHIKQITDSVGRVININMIANTCRGNAVGSIDANGKIYNYSYSIGDDGGHPGYLLKEVKPPVGPGWKYFYDFDGINPEGELISVTYPSGGVVEYQYDTFNLTLKDNSQFKFRAIKSRTASGPNITPGTWTYSYDPLSNQDSTAVTDPCGNKVVYKFYGLRGGSFVANWAIGLLNVKEIRDANNNVAQAEINTWDPHQISVDQNIPEGGYFVPLLGSKAIIRDGNDYFTNLTYNTFYGAPTKIEEFGELSRTADISYYENLSVGNYIVGKPLVTTVSNGAETKTITDSYDGKGNLVSENKYGITTEFSYRPDGNLEWQKNARGFYTHFDQYNFGIAGRIRYGSSNVSGDPPVYTETRTINWEGTIAGLVNGRGHQTLFDYDDVNRLIQITPPPSGESQTLISYDNTAGQSYIIQKGISAFKYNFDGLGRPIGAESNIGIKTEIRYDGCGRKTYESLPFDGSTLNAGDSFTYDALGRVTIATHSDNTSTNYSYLGNTVTVRNERNIDTTFNFESFGVPEDKRLASIKDAQNNMTSYQYNLIGNVTSVSSPIGGSRVFIYDSKNLLVSETHPESGITVYTYDAVGNVMTKTDAKNQTIAYQYDALDRLTFIDHPSGEDDVIYAYDEANNRTLMESGSGSYSYSYEYDPSNRLTRQNVNLGGINYSVDSGYDERNNITQSKYPSGKIVNYNYDAGNRVLDIFDASNILFIGNISYNPSGSPTHYVNIIGVNSDFTYDNRQRLKTVKISRIFPFLMIKKDGLGKGTITSNPLGIDCGGDCTQIYPAENIQVVLTATPDNNSNFVGWSGDPDCSDGNLVMDGVKTCIATFALKSNQFTLTVNKAGAGSGTITSNPVGIDCGSDCTEDYDANTQVTLTPTPNTGSRFARWNGDPDCSDGFIVMNANKTCTATFDTGQFTLTVNKSGTGTGTVKSNPAGIDCGSDCAENYNKNTQVALVATPDAGSTFVGWTGDADCTDGMVTIDANKSCNANFVQKLTLTIQKNGTGNGTVVSTTDSGINCGSDCSEGYDTNYLVSLDATPDPGSQFAGWSGNPDCSDGIVFMDVNKTCISTFNLLPPTQRTLTVSKQGDGFGTVTSTPFGINCGNDCTEAYNQNTQVTLTPTPNAGSIFGGWSGDPDCSDSVVTMDANKTCTSIFTQSTQQFRLNVSVSGFGLVNASVGAFDGGISCLNGPAPFSGNDCAEDYAINTQVRLRATPTGHSFQTSPPIDYNSTFLGWSGDPDCSDGMVTMNADKTCIAIFTPFKLNVFTFGGGTVNISPKGNTCTTYPGCSKYYRPNTQVTLTPVPNAGSNFAGWTGDPDCSDGIVTMDREKTCTATFVTPQFTLTVNKTGTGTGTVSSTPVGIDCGSDCTQDYGANTVVLLTATPDAGSIFAGWSGDPDCSDGVVTMGASKTCTATFTQQSTLTLTKTGTGAGTVNSSPTGINCGSDCTENYAPNAQVTLTATPSTGSIFGGWSGDPDCSDGIVTMNVSKTCTATFTKSSTKFTLTLTKTGTGLGTVKSNPTGINCGSDCYENYNKKTKVILTATPTTGSTFAGWSGNSDCLDGVVKMNANKTCTATFNLSSASISNPRNSIKAEVQDLHRESAEISGANSTPLKQSTDDQNLNSSKNSRLGSYVESLRLGLISLLFATSVFAAQATILPVPFIDLEYSYDGAGNVAGIVDHIDSTNNCSMQYDNLDRLIGSTGPWGPGSFSYDATGNRTNKNIAGANINYSYGSSDNRLSGYSYDANGNLLDDGNFTYDYDSENRLIAVRSGGNVIVQYQYDGDGRRIKRVTNTDTAYFAYGTGLDVMTEFNGQGVPKFDYIYAGNRNVARVNFDSTGAIQSKSFYHSDQLGSTLAITDETTTILWNQMYLPFGDFYSGSGSLTNTHQYTGKEFDGDAGLYYYGARYYHPGLGRFISVDPAGGNLTDPQSWNRYSYTLNNPFKYVDPDGEEPVFADGKYAGEIDDRVVGFGLINDPAFIGSVVSLGGKVERGIQNFLRVSDLDTSIAAQFFANVFIDLFIPTDVRSAQLSLIPTPPIGGTLKGIKVVNIFEGVPVESFEGTIRRRLLQSDVASFRFSGGVSERRGRFLTTKQTLRLIDTPQDAQKVLNLPPGATAETLNRFIIPKGTEIFIGRIKGGAPGATQIFIKSKGVLK